MAEEQQKNNVAEETLTDEPTNGDTEAVALPDVQDDTPAVALVGDETAAAIDQSTTHVHPDAPEEEAAPETPETTAEAEEKGIVGKAVAAMKEAAEAVAHTVEEVVEAVTGKDDDGDTRLLDQAVDEAVSEIGVPEADEADLIVGGEREPITSFEDAGTLRSGTYVGYTGEIIGRVITLAELEHTLQEEETVAAHEQLAALIDQTITDVTENEIVKGRVVSVGEKEIVIDFGFKSDGVVAKNEFDRELKPGDQVEIFLERIEDYHGQPVISKTKADQYRRWERVEHAFEREEVLEGTIIRRIKGGMIVQLFGDLEAFLPGSQIDVRPVRDFDAYLEKRMEFKVVKINPANENIVVSHKALIEKDLEAQRDKILGTMEPGQILEGTVKNITDFGVFIDLGGVDGLLHITDLSWGRVSHPSELVELDEKMKVVVLDYDKERQRISLGLKQLQSHPWENIDEKFAEGQIIEGKVVSITDYGAFVELEKGIEGLVHISEMSWTDHIRHPSQKVSLGQLVNVKILNIDREGKKISLGMKQLESNPWEGLIKRFPPGTVLRGKVRNLTNFGVFVEIEPGIDGLVHISDLSWTKKVKHPSEVVRKGQDLDVVVLDIDENRQRVSLGHKQIQTNPWANFANVYAEGTDVTAKIVGPAERGLTVELPLEAEGFVPQSELKNDIRTYRAGDDIELRVTRFDASQKEIVLSETAKDRAEERAVRNEEEQERRRDRDRERREVEDFKKSTASGPTTLGELSGLEDLKRQMAAAEAEAAATETAELAAIAETTTETEPAASESIPEPADSAATTEVETGTEASTGDAEAPEAQIITSGPASGQMEGTPGEPGEGAPAGKAKQDEQPTEPPADQAQRTEDAGSFPDADQSQAAHKDVNPQTDAMAEAAEALVEDETPVTDIGDKPVATTEADVTTGEIEAFTKTGDDEERAVTTEAVKAQAEAEADEATEEAEEEEKKA